MRCALSALLALPALVAPSSAHAQTRIYGQAPQAFHKVRLPDAVFARHRAKVMEKAKAMGPGTLVVVKSMPQQPSSGDSFHLYRQDSDFYYLTGVEEEKAIAMLDADKGTYTLFVQARDHRREAWDGPRLGAEGAKAKGADEAFELPTGDRMVDVALRKAKRIVLVDTFDEDFRRRVLDIAYPLGASSFRTTTEKSLVDGRPLLAELRVIKDPEEVEMIQHAVDVSIEGHLAAMRGSRGFTNEGQVAGAMEGTVRSLGARFLAYETIAGAGNDGCVLHYPFNDQPIEKGSLILMDASGEIGFYTSDITRTWPANGKYSAEQRALYELVLKAQEAGIAAMKPGAPHQASMKAASRVVSDGLVDLGLIKGDKEEVYKRGDWNRFLIHGVSHYVGLDVHDAGDYGRPLEPGMVLTMEPGIYIPKGMEGVEAKWQGIGIRIEDVILVTPDGPKNLSARLPRKVEEVEKVVQGGAAGRK